MRDLTLFNLNAKFHLFKYDDVMVRPFVFAGFGLLAYNNEDFEAENILDQFQYPDLGLGLNIKISPAVNITFDETLLLLDRDRNANVKMERYLQHAVGVSFNLGKSQDADNDGISDRNDACPEVFGLKQFEGCPEEVKKQDPTPDKVKTSAPKVSLYVVNFESGNSNINKKSKSILNSIVDILKKTPNFKLDIKGYTDTDGDENMNLRLSDSRAKIVKKYLTKRGISDKRLFTKGYGEQNPIADNNTEESNAKNRSVELILK